MQIKIAIFGLSLNVLEQIKVEIRAMFPSLSIAWTNIQDPELDILLVNEIFFKSPNIQELAFEQKIPYLRLFLDESQSGAINEDVLYLPFVSSVAVKDWFKKHVNTAPELPRSNGRNNFNQKKHSNQQSSHPLLKAKKIDQVIQAFFDERNDNIQLFDGHGTIGLMNTRTEQVWLDKERKFKGADRSLNYTYATMHMAQSVVHQQGLDLKTWLWNTLWFSNELLKPPLKSTYYKLEFWPQPDAIMGRNEIFKIAACFEKGASIQQIESSLDLAPETISKFVAVSIMCKALREIPVIDAHFYVNPSVKVKTGFGQYFDRFKTKFGF